MSALRAGHDSGAPSTLADLPAKAVATGRLRRFFSKNWSVGELVDFHTREKFLLMAHDRRAYQRLGRLVARARDFSTSELAVRYQRLFMSALERTPTTGQQVNVLQHLLGFFKKRLGTDERSRLLDAIEAYGSGRVPLEVPLRLVREQARRHQLEYLSRQHYLTPG